MEVAYQASAVAAMAAVVAVVAEVPRMAARPAVQIPCRYRC